MDLINQASFTASQSIDANFCQTFGTFEEGRKLLASLVNVAWEHGSWMRQDWIGIHIDKNEY